MLNEKQLKAVNADDRFIFLLAGAGTGKTTVIVNKVKRLIKGNIEPENVLVLSFTRKSVKDLRSRFTNDKAPLITTFHGLAYKFLSAEKEIKIVEETQLINFGFNKDEITKIDFYKRNNKLNRLVSKYNLFLKKNGLLDYTDLEYVLVSKLKNNKNFKETFINRFKYIFVDEFQDTSIIQYKLLKELIKDDTNLFCVGDPNQSIYAFRGASKKVIKAYIKDFKAQVYLLDENYRSAMNILKGSNNLIKHNKSAFSFDLITNNKREGEVIIKAFNGSILESKFIAEEIRKLLKEKFFQEDIAVIYRNHNYANNIKEELCKTYFDRINFLTIHQAKGLEFRVVFMISLDEGKLPFIGADIEEERRLFYVGITRAKERLYLLSSSNRGKESRFIEETRK